MRIYWKCHACQSAGTVVVHSPEHLAVVAQEVFDQHAAHGPECPSGHITDLDTRCVTGEGELVFTALGDTLRADCAEHAARFLAARDQIIAARIRAALAP